LPIEELIRATKSAENAWKQKIINRLMKRPERKVILVQAII
jgi:hypothetical protein